MLSSRQFLEPLRCLTIRQFALRSRETLKAQDATRVRAQSDSNVNARTRKPPLRVAADLDLELEFRQRIDILMGRTELWQDLIPQERQTVEFNAWLYRMGASLEAAVEEVP